MNESSQQLNSKDEAKIVLLDEERQRCEVWTRVMGYHRPVASFNTGKKGEHAERRFFLEQPACAESSDQGAACCASAE